MKIDRVKFFNVVRKELVKGPLSYELVVAFEEILDAWEEDHPGWDKRWLAYALATAWHETAFTMRPIEEYGKGKGRKYGKPDPKTGKTYYGRGYVQLTWAYNYSHAGQKLGLDLLNKPELALEADTAAKIMFWGMYEGWFTGKKFSDYFDGEKTDWINARRIINGTDKARAIAGYAELFYKGVR